MNIQKLLAVLLSGILLIAPVTISSGAEDIDCALKFSEDGKFTILQITDPQDDQNPAHELIKFISLAVEEIKPDLIVFTGDIVEDSRIGDIGKDDECLREGVVVEDIRGNLDYEATLANVKTAVDAVFAPVEAAGIPFAVTQGNNDYNSEITNEDWLKIYASYPHCITADESDDEAGKIDSYIEIEKYASEEAGFGIWLLDNGKSFTEGQAQWFNSVETSPVPSIVFEHIPVPEIGNLFEKCEIYDAGAVFNSTETFRLNPDIASGVYYTAYEPGETGNQFAAWKSKGVTGAFFGHVHTDGYTGIYDTITLGLTYGCEFAKPGPYGCRTITLSEDGSFETELFTYENGSLFLQNDEPYTQYRTKFASFVSNLIRLYKFIINVIASMLNIKYPLISGQ